MLDEDGKSLESEAMPVLDDDGQDVERQPTATAEDLYLPSSQESQQEDAIVSKSQPVASENSEHPVAATAEELYLPSSQKAQQPVETPEEIEQRVRKQVLEEVAVKTTTAA